MSKKSILIIASNVTRDASTTKWLHPSIGIYRIAGYLKKNGHSAECYDVGLHTATKNGLSLEEKILEHDWDIIAFSVLEESLAEDIAAMHMAERLRPDALQVAGGIEAQYNYQTILDKSPCNICVLGEGEHPMLGIADGKPLHEIAGVVFRNDAKPMTQDEFWEVTEATRYEEIPYEDYWDHYVALYGNDLNDDNLETIHTVRIFTRNYCPVGCKFCVSTNQLSDAAGVKKVNVVDIIDDRLVELVKRVVESQPRVKTIYFTDDDFCLNLRKVQQFCRQLIDLKLDVSFICFSRADRLDEETISLMAKAGFRVINTGLESFSEETWKEYGSKYTKKGGRERIIRNLDLLKKYGVTPFVSVILCSPEGKLSDVELTAAKLVDYLDDGGFEAGVNVSVQPFKGSYYYEHCHEFESEIVPVPDSKHTIRKDYFIRARDPEVRELQYRFLERYPQKIKSLHESGQVMHATSSAQARFKLALILELVEELKGERKNKNLNSEKESVLRNAGRGVTAIHQLDNFRSGSAL